MIDFLIQNGRLKSFSYVNGKTEVAEKLAPRYHIKFEVVDKRLLKQKKASRVISIDKVVPQDMLSDVYAEIAIAIEALNLKHNATLSNLEGR